MRARTDLLPCLALLYALLASPLAQAQDNQEDLSARFETISDLETVPDGVVTALAQDRAGFLWIGSTRGLIRHDGYSFRRFVHRADDPGSLGGNLTRSLLLARDGRLWVGTDADGVSVYDPATERFEVHRHRPGDAHSLPRGGVLALAEGEGGIWVGLRGGGVALLEPRSGQVTRYRAGSDGALPPREDFVHALLVDRDDTLWVGTRAGLRRLEPRASEMRPVLSMSADSHGLGADAIYSLLEPGDGRIWVGTQNGQLLLLDPASMAVDRPRMEQGTAPGTLDTVSAMTRLGNGEVWLARASGIEVRSAEDGELLRYFRHDPARPTGLAGNEVRALLQDRSGLLWVGSFGGGVQWHDPANRWARVLRGEPGHGGVFQQPDVSSVLQRANGEVWLGTRGRGIAILDAQLRLIGGLPPGQQPGQGLGVGWITALTEDAIGRVWFGSRDGLRRLQTDSGTFERFGTEQGLTNLSIRRLRLDRRGTLWIGTGDGLFRLPADSGRVERLALAGGLPLTGEFNAIALDRDDTLWFGASTGLYRLVKDDVAPGRIDGEAQPGLPHESVVGLLVDSQDRLWVDTVDGLFLLHRSGTPWAFESINARFGLAGDFGANLLEDADGRLWTHRQVYDPHDDRLYGLSRSDGVDFGTGWFRSYLRMQDGRLLFGGSRGLLVIEPQRFLSWSYKPPVVLTDVRIDNQPQPVPPDAESLILQPGQRSLSAEFAALDFSGPRRLRYAYRLQGLDTDWTDAQPAQRIAVYRNLSPGSYRLQVRATNRGGDWSTQQIDMPVRVLPQWWETRIFVVLASVAGILLVLFAVRLRMAFLRHQAVSLEALVQRRTQELSQSKAHAERALGQLERAKDQLVETEKMASLGALVAGVAHEINTPIGIAVTAASHLRDLSLQTAERFEQGQMTRGEFREWQRSVAEGNALVLGNLERAGRLISSFKRVAVDQSSEERRQFELDGFLEEVRTSLLPSFRRSGCRLDIECPRTIMLDTYPGALFQIFTNLVNNALIHAFADAQAGQMKIHASREGSEIWLRFSDDGCGMPTDVAARAFDPFFTTRRSDGGSGLGLHLVYNLVTQLLGGRIELHSSPGQGTHFDIHLPIKAPG